jgi:hypothetical protein
MPRVRLGMRGFTSPSNVAVPRGHCVLASSLQQRCGPAATRGGHRGHGAVGLLAEQQAIGGIHAATHGASCDLVLVQTYASLAAAPCSNLCRGCRRTPPWGLSCRPSTAAGVFVRLSDGEVAWRRLHASSKGEPPHREAGVRLPRRAAGAADDVDRGEMDADFESAGPATIILNTSDAGSDQALAARLLSTLVRPGRCAVVGTFCMLHQIHLVVARSLQRTTGSRYVQRLAMICHLWRASGMVVRIRSRFSELFGDLAARQCACGAPPLPIRGRWGSVHASEGHLLRCTWPQLRDVPLSQISLSVVLRVWSPLAESTGLSGGGRARFEMLPPRWVPTTGRFHVSQAWGRRGSLHQT